MLIKVNKLAQIKPLWSHFVKPRNDDVKSHAITSCCKCVQTPVFLKPSTFGF